MSSPNKGQTPAIKVPQISEDTLRDLIQAQTGEQAIRTQELAIRKAEIEYQSKHASDILAVQERDREKHRAWIRKCRTDILAFATAVLILVLVFIAYCLYLGKDQIVQDIIKFALGGLAGGFGGYGYRASKKPKEEEHNGD